MKKLFARFAGTAALVLASVLPAHADRLDPLTPDNSVVLMVDYQPPFVFSVQNGSAWRQGIDYFQSMVAPRR